MSHRKIKIMLGLKIGIVIGLFTMISILVIPEIRGETKFNSYPELTEGDFFKYEIEEKTYIDNFGNNFDDENYLGFEDVNFDLYKIEFDEEKEVIIGEKTYDCVIVTSTWKASFTLEFKYGSTETDDDKYIFTLEITDKTWKIKTNQTIVKEVNIMKNIMGYIVNGEDHISESWSNTQITYNKIEQDNLPLKVGKSWSSTTNKTINVTERSRMDDDEWDLETYEYSESTKTDYEVISEESINVSAGIFSCLKIKSQVEGETNYEMDLMCESGFSIKRLYYEGDEIFIQMQLTAYEMNNEIKPPTVSISYPSHNEEINGIYDIKGSATINYGEITTIQIRIDTGDWLDAVGTTNWTYAWDLADVKEGTHNISVRAFDGIHYSETKTIEIIVVEDEEKEGLNMIIIIIPIIAIVAVVGIFVVVKSTKKSSTPKTSRPPTQSEQYLQPHDLFQQSPQQQTQPQQWSPQQFQTPQQPMPIQQQPQVINIQVGKIGDDSLSKSTVVKDSIVQRSDLGNEQAQQFQTPQQQSPPQPQQFQTPQQQPQAQPQQFQPPQQQPKPQFQQQPQQFQQPPPSQLQTQQPPQQQYQQTQPQQVKSCPTCQNQTRFINQYQSFYCETCQKYV